MHPKVFIPQPIPEVALNRLKKVAEVEVFPYVDRMISPEELLKAVKEKNYLYALGEIPYTAEVIDTALPSLKGIAAMYIFPKFVAVLISTNFGKMYMAAMPFKLGSAVSITSAVYGISPRA